MATDILGLKANDEGDKNGFKKVSFDKLKDKNGEDKSVKAPTTFKDAIDKNIETINRGLQFAGNTGTFTKQLGATVTIKGDGTDLISTADTSKGEISFALSKETDLNNNTTKVPTTQAVKTYVDSKVQNISSTLGLEADNSKDTTYGKVALNTQKLKIAGTSNEIKTKVDSNGQIITISLDDKIKNDIAGKADKTLGNIDQDGKDIISKQAVAAIKAEKEGTSTALSVSAEADKDGKSKTIKVGLNESTLITNLSKDVDFKNPTGNKLVTDKQVSEFIGGKTLTFKDNNKGSHASKLNSEFKLVGNDDITVTVSKDGENGNGQATFVLNKATSINEKTPTNGDKDKVATAGAVKTYVDDALKTAKTEADKTAVKYDDETRDVITLGGKGTSHKPVVIDNLRSGLGIDDINDGGIASIKQGKTRDLVKKLVDGKLDGSSHKAANVSDLKALATAGLNFAGNDSDHLVHKKLGETLQIVGKGVHDVNKFNATDNNIVVKTQNDRLEVSLNSQLTGLQSATFTKDQKTVEITGDKIVLKDSKDSANGNTAIYTADSATLTDENGNTAKLNGQGLTFQGKDGKEAVSLKVAEGKNGKETATLAFAKGADDQYSGRITGLAAPENDTDAANKKYVDDKLTGAVAGVTANRPFDFYLGDEKVTKGADGSFSKATGAKLTEEEVKQVVIKAEPTASPMQVSNVASGLGVDTVAEEQKTKLNTLAEEVNKKVLALDEKTKDLAKKAEALTDLRLMVDSLKQTVNTMPDGTAKDKIRENLQKYETQLSEAKKAQEDAKQALKVARDELIAANKGYNDLYQATDNINDLVKVDSKAQINNVATVGDLQAVARAGVNFAGNDNVNVHKNIGETLTIKGEGEFNSDTSAAGNIKVELAQDGQGLSVKLSDKLQGMTSVETREIHGKKSTFDSNGLKTVSADSEIRVTAQGTEIVGKGANAGKAAGYRLDGVRLQDGAGNHATLSAQQGLRLTGQAGEPSLIATKNGLVVKGPQGDIALDGQRGEILLPDVKPDASGYVAVNKNYVDSQNNELRTQLSNTNREMRAGIAGALAAASLPSSAIPGKSMLAASAGAFKGHSAIALGYSKMSDNGKSASAYKAPATPPATLAALSG